MHSLDPEKLFQRLSEDIPGDLHGHVYVAGSLAAAYEYRLSLKGGVNTKDADLVVHPAGDVLSCREMATKLLKLGWRRTRECYPHPPAANPDQLRAIRLFPPESDDYFLELLGLPSQEQEEAKAWLPLELDDGWYGSPCFRFMSLTSLHRRNSEFGIQYASPEMMALANLLSHHVVGQERIESGVFDGIRRSAKDLGRVVSLARLAERQATFSWPELWLDAMKTCFPQQHATLSKSCGSGLLELRQSGEAMDEAYLTASQGLLSRMNVSREEFENVCDRLIADVIQPVRAAN